MPASRKVQLTSALYHGNVLRTGVHGFLIKLNGDERVGDEPGARVADVRTNCVAARWFAMEQRRATAPHRAGARRPPAGMVVLLIQRQDGTDQHDRATLAHIGARLAVIKGFEFAGEFDLAVSYPRPLYFVPIQTLLSHEASELGIRDEHDLFGGVVPHGFVATKAITHPVIGPHAKAPIGWSHTFAERVHGAVPLGYSAFSIEDARRAGKRLLERGKVRLKPVCARAGRGQVVVSNADELEAALVELDDPDLSSLGIALEENLAQVRTYSVGQLRVADIVATYYGTQRLTRDNAGAEVYGGSELIVVRGGFDALLSLDAPHEDRFAIKQAQAYDLAAREHFPGLFASRRNYDVAQGVDATGRRRSGVLEQSWRTGGASSAEIAALEAFRAEPELVIVRASCFEEYGEGKSPPAGAIVSFHGIDERVGPIAKYTLIEV